MNVVYIYGLIDPITGLIRYVGKSVNPRKRLNDHCKRCSKSPSHINSWLLGLKKISMKPEILILDEVCENNWIFWEQFYISLLKSWGLSLVNMTDGGENPPINKRKGYKMSDEARLNMSLAQVGNKNNLGKKMSLESRRKLSNSLKGKIPPNKGIPHSDETKRKIGLIHKGNKYTLGFKFSEESKKKMSERRKGIKLSEETRRKMSLAKMRNI